jgi:RimJ/RimL family protein N-acetyltransferase
MNEEVLPVLETRRLRLRALRLEDAPAIETKAGDIAVADTTLAIPHPYPAGEARRWVASLREPIRQGRSAVFALVLKDPAEVGLEPDEPGAHDLVGCVGLGIELEMRRAEIGYWLEKSLWGRGLMTEAVREVLRFGFEECKLERVFCCHLTRNPGSGRVMEKAGMRCEGLQRQHVVKWGRREDVKLYGALREEWLRSDGNGNGE